MFKQNEYTDNLMSEHQISLSKEVYCELLSAANAEGISPADWIASQLSIASIKKISNVTSTNDLIGAIDSSYESNREYQTTPFDEAIAAKLAKQGIKRP